MRCRRVVEDLGHGTNDVLVVVEDLRGDSRSDRDGVSSGLLYWKIDTGSRHVLLIARAQPVNHPCR